MIPTDWPQFESLVAKIKVPVFIGHRSMVNPNDYENVYVLGHPLEN